MKILSKFLLSTFIITCVFAFGALVSATKASAQVSASCATAETIISSNPTITLEIANILRRIFGCYITDQSGSSVEFISSSIGRIATEDGESDQATGYFKFKITAGSKDLLISKNLESTINILKDGQVVGKAKSATLTSSMISDREGEKSYILPSGFTDTYTISYSIFPLAGDGFYSAKAIKVPLIGGEINIDGPDNQFVSDKVYLNGYVSGPIDAPVVSQMYIRGLQSTYAPGQIIKYSVKTLTTEDRIGMPEQGFNIQASIYSSNPKEVIKVDGEYQSVNATYNTNTHLWDVVMRAPYDVSKNYTIDTAFYCSRPNQNLCGEKQINNQFDFTLTSTSLQPSITVISPNGGEIWQKDIIKTIKWNDNVVYPTCAPNTTCVIAPPTYNITLTPEYKAPVCTSRVCPVFAPPVDYPIASNVMGSSYDWTVGLANTRGGSFVPDNYYKVNVCRNDNTGKCDSSDSYFKIVSSSVVNQPPVINGVTAPTTLKVGEKGTWTINASDPENGSLSYSVAWGDAISAKSIAYNQSFVQSTSFTHSFSQAGTYTSIFWVKDDQGQTVETSISVKVIGETTSIPVPVTPVTPVPVVPSPVTTAPVSCGILNVGSTLTPGQSITSCNGKYKFILQKDGNAVLYDSANNALWSSGTQGKSVRNILMQGDGNLVIYGTDSKALWATMKFGSPKGLSIQDDGNLVIYGTSGRVIWNSNTQAVSFVEDPESYAAVSSTWFSFWSFIDRMF